uniref:SGTA homodimerisation domain-containing protein n=1 Tax=Panagrolaimus davidi TaxID=227884 RepID=A0A914QNM7_9BILA
MSQDPSSTTTPKEPVVKVEEKKLVVSFIQFLRQKVSANECTDSQIEGLEIAVQCLENAFSLTDKNYAFQPSKPLLQLLTEAEGLKAGEEEFPAPSADDIQRANALKEEGNECVKASKFNDAIEKYNQAIKLNRDPVYFCNRAAAYCRLEQYDLAIQDCRTALALDENYAKAYGRMGLALSCQNRYDAAIEAYKKALELDPNNDSYKSNLAIAEEKVREASQRFQNNPGANPFGGLGSLLGGAGAGGVGGMPGGMPDLGSLMNNPQMMQAAMQMMNDPNMQNLMGSMMEQFMGGSAGGAGGGGFNDLLAAGQSMAQQMQQANPELVEQLRQQFSGTSTEEGGNQQNQGNNPSNPDNNQQQ